MQDNGRGRHSTHVVDSSDIANPAWLRRGVIVLYAFLFLCIVSGITWVYYSAYQGQIFHAVIGAAIAIGGSGVALVKLLLMRIGSIVVRNSMELERIDRRMEIIEHQLSTLLTEISSEVNLSNIGDGAPEKLAAASLQTSTFPRLLPQDEKNEEEFIPTRSSAADEDSLVEEFTRNAITDSAPESVEEDIPDTDTADSIEVKWQEAFEANDLVACTRIISTAEGVLLPEQIASMQQWLDGAIVARRKHYRETFAQYVREEKYDEAVEIGHKIVSDFPESGMAQDFRRLEPHLLARADQQRKTARSSTG